MSKQELVDSMIFSFIDLLLKNPSIGKKHIRSALKLALEVVE